MDNRALVPSNTFDMMERADEQLVLDEIKGRAMDALVYEIRQGGQTVTGLSLAGVRETARVMNANGKARIGISDREPLITETEDYYEVKVYAQDVMNGGGYWGLKRQSKKYGNGTVNQFALEQALAKAQRNALRGLIPEWFTKEMIDAFRKQGQSKVVEGNGHVSQPARARQSWAASSALISRISENIPYYGGIRPHIINALTVLDKEGKIKLTMSDDEAFKIVNEHSNQKANEQAEKQAA